uniref:Uncharacterized protein n=1 Tax=Poecilia mexicana TaxID=48701 RepID=A0A3B3WW39_9TELE
RHTERAEGQDRSKRTSGPTPGTSSELLNDRTEQHELCVQFTFFLYADHKTDLFGCLLERSYTGNRAGVDYLTKATDWLCLAESWRVFCKPGRLRG